MLKLALAFALLPLASWAQTEIELTAADGVAVFADAYTHEGDVLRGTIVLFHQADSNAAEYATIAPRLAALGFDALAVDQRSGGSMFMATNRTATALGRAATYEAALPDMQAALDYVITAPNTGPVILWGSSYSSSLALVLAAQNQGKVDAVMSFSPGEYFAGIKVADAAATLTIPVYLSSSGTDSEMEQVVAIASGIAANLVTIDDPTAGRHGSSTLIEASNRGGWADNWIPVGAFLDMVAPAP